MGKPFKKELLALEDTMRWSNSLDVSSLSLFFETNPSIPLLVVGSGGSYSACSYANLLYESKFTISKAVTPFGLLYSEKIVEGSKVLFISASGKNTDIQFALRKSLEFNCKVIGNLSMKYHNPLQKAIEDINPSFSINYELPTGKDGFLATNSLVAFFTLLYKSFNTHSSIDIDELTCFNDEEYIEEYKSFSKEIENRFNITVLYGGWGEPVAVDLESKFTEAALGAIQLADYRNFGHGRHHWFDKHKKTSAIIAIVTPQEKKIAEKTIALIPNEIPRLFIETNISRTLSSIDLLIKSFHLVNLIGETRKIDPGKPGVPDFGSKLYNLKYSSFYKISKRDFDNKSLAISRKAHIKYGDLNLIDFQKWSFAYDDFVKKITNERYTTLIFDYDGTLSSNNNRYDNILNEKIKSYFEELLSNKIKIAVVTGRGKSIKEILRKSIKEEFWNLLYVGYYNGVDFGSITDDSIPNTQIVPNKDLIQINEILQQEYILNLKDIDIDIRPYQLTIKTKDHFEFNQLKDICSHIISLKRMSSILILESSHSLDIIVRPKASKINIIEKLFNDDVVLCIGDKGQFPGNDFELLSTPFSLSVDEVSYHPHTCWNLTPNNLKNQEALLFYLNCIKINNGFFKLSL